MTKIFKKSNVQLFRKMTAADRSQEKKEAILARAIERFSHYGFHKTTMQEIADDLGLSKALLYYYFPGKDELIAEVVRRIIALFEEEFEQFFKKEKNVRKNFYRLLEKRREYVQKYFHIGIEDQPLVPAFSPVLFELISELWRNEEALFARVLEKGVQHGQFELDNIPETAALLHAAINGLIISERSQKAIDIEERRSKALLERQKKLVDIFIDGLSSPTTQP